MKICFLVATAAVIASVMQPTLAFAEGRKADRVWNPEDPAGVMLAGDEVCIGSKKQHSCMLLVQPLQEINIQSVSRPEGLNQNIVTNRIVAADETGYFRRGEAGQLLAVVMDIRSTANSAAVWNQGLSQVPAALMNGVGASVVQSLIGPCAGGQCQGGGGGSVAYAISGSEATALLEASLGGCLTGACAPPPAHVAPGNQGS
jgi:hypothetical protein